MQNSRADLIKTFQAIKFEREPIISLTGLLARGKVKPMKVEVPLDFAFPFNRTIMSSWRPQFVVSRVPLSDFDADLNKTASDI